MKFRNFLGKIRLIGIIDFGAKRYKGNGKELLDGLNYEDFILNEMKKEPRT